MRLADGRLGIVIPTRNRGRMLDAIVREILPACEELNVTVTLSDNCSTDDTEARARRLASESGLVRYFKTSESLPIERSLMASLQRCEAEYALWSGDDDCIHPDGLRTIARLLTGRDPSVIVFQSSQIPEGLSVDLDAPLLAQLRLAPTGAPDTLRTFSDAAELFRDQLQKPPLGTFVVRVQPLLATPYERFYYSLHPHLGAMYDYLAVEQEANGVVDAVLSSEAFSMALIRLGSDRKAWSELVEHIAHRGFPSWFRNLHPLYQPHVDEGLALHRHLFRAVLTPRQGSQG